MCGANRPFWAQKWHLLVTLDIPSAVALFSYNIIFRSKKGKVVMILNATMIPRAQLKPTTSNKEVVTRLPLV